MQENGCNKRILIVVSQIHKAISHEWIAEDLRNRNYEVHFALLNAANSEIELYLQKNQFPFVRISYFGKYDIPLAIYRLYRYIRNQEIEIVHAHLFEGGIIGMLAAKVARIQKRIYTRHHSTFHHSYFPKMIKYDRMINFVATDIIATSEIVKKSLLFEKVPESKIYVVNHGFKLEQFENVSPQRVQYLRDKYNVNSKLVIGVIARWTEWKGVQYIIPAFKRFLTDHPHALLILSNSKGEYEFKIRQLLNEIPENSYRIIQFEEDFIALYKLFDIFIHVPINDHAEAFGQVYIESLASGIPSIFTKSGVANEFINHEENALLANYRNSQAIYESMNRILADPILSTKIKDQGLSAVRHRFQFREMMDKLDTLYMK